MTLWGEAFKEHRSTGYIENRLRNYKREDVLSFLSKKNVMPQYGFPVDTVGLELASIKNGNQFGVELQRDLAMAISEYAPGSQVVANGELFTGRYIRTVPKIGWKMYDYMYCEQCGTLNIDLHTGEEKNEKLTTCRGCEAPLNQKGQKTFIVPAFGFGIDPNAIRKPGLIRPEKTYRTDVYYVGYRNNMKTVDYQIGRVTAQTTYGEKDEMAILNRSDFHVCRYCGYAETGTAFTQATTKEHNTPSGRKCFNQILKRYSLGYRFETDVFQLQFPDYPLDHHDLSTANSVLYALIRGIVHVLDLEDSDIAGCLQAIKDGVQSSYEMIFYDTTPGGAGHVRRLQNPDVLKRVIEYAYYLMKQCTCGDQEGHASCYACLRSYQNQKVHDILDRSLAMDYLRKLLGN